MQMYETVRPLSYFKLDPIICQYLGMNLIWNGFGDRTVPKMGSVESSSDSRAFFR